MTHARKILIPNHERPLIGVPVPHPAPSEETEIFRRENDFQMFAKAGVIPLHLTSVNKIVQKRFYQKTRVQ